MKTFRAALIGAGAIAISHLKAISRCGRSELVGIADIDQQKVTEFACTYDTIPYVDYKEMVKITRPDIVIIALPHFLHKEVAVWCLRQGCHILLEKPMALNVQECNEIIEISRQYQRSVIVGHIQHYFATNIKAREIIQSGQLGRLVMINDRRHSNYFRADRPKWFLEKEKSGGGIVMNLGSHSIDKIQWLSGTKVQKVKASLTYYVKGVDVEGSGCLYLQLNDEIAATVSLSGYRGSVQRDETELLFTDGQMKINASGKLWISVNREYELVDLGGKSDPFMAQWNEVVDHILSGKEIGISAEYGRSVVATIEAVYRSHETGVEQETFTS